MWIVAQCLLVIQLGALCAAADLLSLRDLKHHRGRHNHHNHKQDTTPEPTTAIPEVEEDLREDFEHSCCSRQQKFVAIGFGVSGEVVQVDVGQCHKSCTNIFSITDFDTNASARKACPSESSCLPSKSRLQRVSTLHGIQELAVINECECRHKPEHCHREPHNLLLFPGTPFETHLDVGVCSGRCHSESDCRPVRNKTVSIPGPNGMQCHSIIEDCSCAASCYRISSLETVYDYSDILDNDTEATPAVKEIDVGQCVGSCSGRQTRKCLFRDQTDPSKCLAGLYGKQSSCTPSHFKVHHYMNKDHHAREIISITDCKCM